jgi:hypothetical protein
MTAPLPSPLAELNEIADALDRSVFMGGAHTYRLAIRLRAVAAQIAERERERDEDRRLLLASNVYETERANKFEDELNQVREDWSAATNSLRQVAEAVREAAAEIAKHCYIWQGSNNLADFQTKDEIERRIRALDLAPILAAEESREPEALSVAELLAWLDAKPNWSTTASFIRRAVREIACDHPHTYPDRCARARAVLQAAEESRDA